MHDTMTAAGTGHLTIRRVLRGAYRLIAEDRATGERREGPWVGNAVVDAGKQAFLDRVRGVGTAWGQATSRLQLYSGGTLRKQITGTFVAPSHATLNRVVWEWRDISADTYTNVNQAIFSHSGTAVQFSSAVVGFGDKTDAQNWIVQYRLDFSGSTPDLVTTANEGLDLMLRMFTGNQTTYFDGSSQLLVFSDAGRTQAMGPQTVNATFPTRAAQTLTYRWTVAAGTMTGSWHHLLIARNASNPPGGPILTGARLRDRADQLGTKGPTDEWVWTYTLSI
jgi:hypothetical protein